MTAPPSGSLGVLPFSVSVTECVKVYSSSRGLAALFPPLIFLQFMCVFIFSVFT